MAAEQRAHALVHDRLHERAQLEAVARGDDVQRPAHERDPHDEPALDEAREVVGMEVLEARPQPVVGPVGVLRLQPDEVLERVGDAQGLTPQQELTFEERTIERSRSQDCPLLDMRARRRVPCECGGAGWQ